MRFKLSLILALSLAASISATAQTRTRPAAKPETSPLNFVTEYIRELAATEQMRASSRQELTQAKDDSFATSTTTMIHWDTLSQLELRSEIAILRGMRQKSVFEATPLVFSTLIDMKPDSRNHASHLVITKAERDRLVETIANDFGAKLDEKDQSYPVASASVLKAYLLKDYKSADEPWD
jgi:hypothetical protein